ncbi:MAG: flagellar biosynthesis regulator FlaF [Pseudomonadota bacterium]
MEAYRQAQSAYGNVRGAVKSPSQIEYQAFAQITKNIKSAAVGLEDATEFPRLAAALHENLRLWTIIASDVASNGNGLPETLRAQFFYLAEFTRAHTQKVLKREAEVEDLVDINTAVMRGLRAQERTPCPA